MVGPYIILKLVFYSEKELRLLLLISKKLLLPHFIWDNSAGAHLNKKIVLRKLTFNRTHCLLEEHRPRREVGVGEWNERELSNGFRWVSPLTLNSSSACLNTRITLILRIFLDDSFPLPKASTTTSFPSLILRQSLISPYLNVCWRHLPLVILLHISCASFYSSGYLFPYLLLGSLGRRRMEGTWFWSGPI